MNNAGSVDRIILKSIENDRVNQFKELFTDEELVDVTLACDGGQQIKAHKVVLALASPTLRQILVTNDIKPLTIFLKSVKLSVLKAMVQFIYLNEVKLDNKCFDDFQALAAELGIDGLHDKVHIESDPVAMINDSFDMNSIHNTEEDSAESNTDNESVETLVEMEAENNSIYETNEEVAEKNMKDVLPVEVTVNHCAEKVEWNSSKFFQCDKCEFLTVYKVSLRKHTLFRHDGITHPCTICESVLSCQASLKTHIKAKHEGVRFPCDLCNFKATSLSLVKKHRTKTHLAQ